MAHSAVRPEAPRPPARGDEGGEPPAADARPGPADEPRRRRDHRHGHLRPDRAGRPRQDGPGADALVRRRGGRLRLRGPLLRRVRLDGPGRRLGLHLRLRDARRALRLDHRLGPRPRVRRRLRHRGARLVAATSRTSSASSASTCRRPARSPRSTTTRASGTSWRPGRFIDLPAIVITFVITAILVNGIRESATLQRGDGRLQARHRPLRDRRRRVLRQPGELAAVRALRLHRHQLLRPHALRPDRRGRRAARDAGRAPR